MFHLDRIARNWLATEEEYRADESVNFHTLADFHRDPRAWLAGHFDQKEETDAMRFGTALHARILEGDAAFGSKVAIFDPPINAKTGEPFGTATKAYKDALADFMATSVGKTPITKGDAELVDVLEESFRFHPVAPSILGREWRETELNVKGEYEIDGEPVAVKGRLDCVSDAGLVDLKTTAQLAGYDGRDRFRYACYDFGYIAQLGFYHRLLTDFCGAPPTTPCWLIALEKTAPNRVAVYRLSQEVVEKARGVVWSWLCEYVRARRTNIFESRFDSVQLIDRYDAERDLT